MSNVHELPDQGSHLCTVAMYRRGDGSIKAVITDMPAHVIESEPSIPVRMWIASRWLHEACGDLMNQSERFSEPAAQPDPTP